MFRFIFVKFFASGLKKRNVLVSTETLWLMATGKATREALLSEAGFEKVFRTQIFFPSNAFMASARSFNMFQSMLQLGLMN